MTYFEALDFLYNLQHGSIKLGLERIEAATEALGHPERKYATVHVAGTNGKGSTCAFCASILEAAGYRSGLLTSPHLLAYGERIRIGGRMLPEEEIAALTEELKPLILETGLSFFEATTALAFEAFARAGVEAAVIEVGMGGRLDATNVVTPDLTVITSIDLDHTKSLGQTREQIAGEKAGIMKPEVPLLFARCSAGIRAVFEERGRALGAAVHALAEFVALEKCEELPGGTTYHFRELASGKRSDRMIKLHGEHQVWNALLAEQASALLSDGGLLVPTHARERGLAQVAWPGRFHLAAAEREAGPVIFDVAHNPSGGETVVRTYRRWATAAGVHAPPALIVGMLGDKNHIAFFQQLRELSDQLHLIALDSSRAGPLEDVGAAARQGGFEPHLAGTMSAAWEAAAKHAGPILVTGSFLTVEAGMQALGLGPAEQLFPGGSVG